MGDWFSIIAIIYALALLGTLLSIAATIGRACGLIDDIRSQVVRSERQIVEELHRIQASLPR